jgi:hypothetical protein
MRHFARAGPIRSNSTYPSMRRGHFLENGEQRESGSRRHADFKAGICRQAETHRRAVSLARAQSVARRLTEKLVMTLLCIISAAGLEP